MSMVVVVVGGGGYNGASCQLLFPSQCIAFLNRMGVAYVYVCVCLS